MAKKINVLFLIDKDTENANENNVFAFFPDYLECYAHIGQHSACCKEYANECKEADFYLYAPLLNELKQIGYKNLNVLNNSKN